MNQLLTQMKQHMTDVSGTINASLSVQADAAPQSSRLVIGAAALWGASTWFPVGLAYLALLLTFAGLLLAPDRSARWAQARTSGLLLFPVLFFAWFLLSYIVGPRGELADTLVFHSVRFVLTIALGLMLWRSEARAALAGFAALAAVMLVAVLVEVTIGGVPRWPGLISTLEYTDNKSIRAGLLMVIAAGFSLVGLLWYKQLGADLSVAWRRVTLALVWIAFLAGLSAVVFYLQSRTAMLVLPIVLMGLVLHRYRSVRSWLLAISVVLTLAAGAYLGSDNVSGRIDEGVHSLLVDAKNGTPTSSWGLRYHFYKFSLQQAADHPFLGAGPGTWRTHWAEREGISFSQSTSNPHNDYLLFAAESGWPAMLLLFLVYLKFLSASFRQRCVWGSLGFAVALVATLTTVVNAGMRDAVFGLSLVWLMVVANSASRNPAPTLAAMPNAKSPPSPGRPLPSDHAT